MQIKRRYQKPTLISACLHLKRIRYSPYTHKQQIATQTTTTNKKEKKKQRIWYEIWVERKFKKETQEKYKNEFQWLSGDRISLKQTNRAYTLSIFKWFLIVVYTHSVT